MLLTLTVLFFSTLSQFAESFEVVPRTLAENSGQDATKVVSSLYAAHTAGTPNVGVNVDADGTLDAAEAEIFDAMKPKYSALQLASDAAITVLRVDTVSPAPPLASSSHYTPSPTHTPP